MQGIVHNKGGDQQGILYGRPSPAGTVVESNRALTVFAMEEMGRAISEANDSVVGYYRIREGNSLQLTTDEINLAALFEKAGSVVLLVERRAGSPEANFFFLDHGAFLNFPLLQFPLDAAELTRRGARGGRTGEEAVVTAAPRLLPSGSGSNSPPPAANGKPASPRRPAPRLSTLAIVVAAAVVSFSAALFLFRPHNRTANVGAAASTLPEARTSLRAERQGDDLKIMWDLNSPAVAGATSGVLDIDDGGTTRQIRLTADQVRFGSLLYSPVSEQISVQLTTLQDRQTTEQASVLVILRRPQQPQSRAGQRSPRIPFEVETQRRVPPRAFVPPTAQRETKPSVELEDLPAIQANPERSNQPAPLTLGSVAPPPAIAAPPKEPAKSATQATPERSNQPAPLTLASAAPPPVIAAPPKEPAKSATQASPERSNQPAPLTLASAAPPPVVAAPPKEPAKSATQASPERSNQPAALPPAIAAPRSETAEPREEGYVAPVLLTQNGVRTPTELLPVLTRPVAVSVRVDVNEAGRVTRAEAIAEKGIHALLLRAAADAARGCRFQPARQGPSPVASHVTIVFHFSP
ncbi:MAG TPA: energy transducer TonB [Bryobacteraceae bacterium]|nr:energy transducer TonB [Bryobacteraceae bacterium]